MASASFYARKQRILLMNLVVAAISLSSVEQAGGQSYGGRDSPTGNDVWVSCNPNSQDGNYDGTACVLGKHMPLYTHDPHARDHNFAGPTLSPQYGGVGTKEYPAVSCTDIGKMTHFGSGFYWIQPSYDVEAFEAYCDLDREGGGWQMCYTTEGGVSMASQTSSPGVNFGEDGYRSDCRNVPFNQVLYVAHPTLQPEHSSLVPPDEETAWFSFNGNNALIASRSGWGGSVNSTWGAGISTKFTGHGLASPRTAACVQERKNSACQYPLVASAKLQQCPDCFSVRPQKGNATSCLGSDVSNCWCDALTDTGCPNGVQAPMGLDPVHSALRGYYVGWHVKITEGTGAGQIRKIKASAGGFCSSTSYATRSSCVAAGSTWTAGLNHIEPEEKWVTPPCSNSKLDGYRCQATCSDTYPSDGSACKNEVVYSTSASCLASCKSFDANPNKRTYSIDTTGADGGVTALSANIMASDISLLVDDDLTQQGMVAGKSLQIGAEIMYISSVNTLLGNYVRVERGRNGTLPAAHTAGDVVTVITNFATNTLPTCDFSCTSKYELNSPGECTPVDWACGHEAEEGVVRGYSVEKLGAALCTGVCTCANDGTPSCSVGNVAGCACRASVDLFGAQRASPWAATTFRLPGGADTDGCSGPFHLCTGFNPYKGYQLRVGGETRTIVAWSSEFKTLQVDAPFTTTPVPAPASDTTWAGASTFELLYAPECTGLFNNDFEKSECLKTQEYELMTCDPGEGGIGSKVSGGLIMTGVKEGCSKVCEDRDFCSDYQTAWFRADTGLEVASGGAFNENGLGHPGVRKLSVGVRYVNNEYEGVNRI